MVAPLSDSAFSSNFSLVTPLAPLRSASLLLHRSHCASTARVRTSLGDSEGGRLGLRGTGGWLCCHHSSTSTHSEIGMSSRCMRDTAFRLRRLQRDGDECGVLDV